ALAAEARIRGRADDLLETVPEAQEPELAVERVRDEPARRVEEPQPHRRARERAAHARARNLRDGTRPDLRAVPDRELEHLPGHEDGDATAHQLGAAHLAGERREAADDGAGRVPD